jgi:class 3 adenylate cyclase
MAYTSNRSFVSIITSCAIGNNRDVIDHLHKHNEDFIDLYIFHDEDCDLLAMAVEGDPPTSPVELAHLINPAKAAEKIRSWLSPHLRLYCQAPLSPVRALATNIPEISDPNETKRLKARDTVLNCAHLAKELGATCVEIVGGPSFIREPGDGMSLRAGSDIVELRMTQLIKSLQELDAALNSPKSPLSVGLALEIEPGPAYLLSDLERVHEVFARLSKRGPHHIGINVDVGHMLLLRDQGERPMDDLRRLMPLVMHFHASDQAIAHFSDLELTSFHSADDFMSWIFLFLELTNRTDINPFFTNTIAVEMEAGHSIHQAIRSARLLRSWLDDAHTQMLTTSTSVPFPLHMEEQFSVVVFTDIVSSTRLFMSLKPDQLPRVLANFVRHMEQLLVEFGGFFDRFTGDGFMATFSSQSAEVTPEEVVDRSLRFVNRCRAEVRDYLEQCLSGRDDSDAAFAGLRIGISCGPVYFGAMNVGPRAQITSVGATVVEAARIVDLCQPDEILASEGVREKASHTGDFLNPKEYVLKGLPGKHRVYQYLPQPLSPLGNDAVNPYQPPDISDTQDDAGPNI